MRNYVVWVVFALMGVACTPKAEYRTIEGFAEGTTYRITWADPAAMGADMVRDSVETLLATFERSLSLYDSSSLLCAWNENRTQTVDRWFLECVGLYQQMYVETDSLLDPTLRPLIAMYGFGGKKGAPRSPSAAELDSIRGFVGLSRTVWVVGDQVHKSDPRVELDFNAVAKGYSVDLVGRLLERLGATHYMVEIGGEVYARGQNAQGGVWRIGIDTPKEGNMTPGADLLGVVELSGRGLATSGNYRKSAVDQNGERLTHTIDPRTGRPERHRLLSATVLAPTCGLADGYATAMMVGGLEWAKEFAAAHSEVDVFLVYAGTGGPFEVYSTLNH